MEKKIKSILKELDVILGKNVQLTLKALQQRNIRNLVGELDEIVDDVKKKTHEHAFKNIRAIFFDIDGTLMHKGKTPKKAVELINELIKKKIIVGIATGRARRDINLFAFIKELNGPLIFEEGCLILKKNSLDLIWDKKIRASLKYLEQVSKKYSNSYDIRWKERSFSIYSAKEFPEVNTLRNISVYRNRNHLNIVPTIANKGRAITYVCQKLRIPLRSVCCVGDDYNDRSMLSIVGFPCTVGNAFKPIKEFVREKGGYVSRKHSYRACIEIMQKIL